MTEYSSGEVSTVKLGTFVASCICGWHSHKSQKHLRIQKLLIRHVESCGLCAAHGMEGLGCIEQCSCKPCADAKAPA
jgi:hypothetical protein